MLRKRKLALAEFDRRLKLALNGSTIKLNVKERDPRRQITGAHITVSLAGISPMLSNRTILKRCLVHLAYTESVVPTSSTEVVIRVKR
ncbi:MAG: hypothetical protein ABWX90_03895 [Candidatus Saccharimonadales bacterium]